MENMVILVVFYAWFCLGGFLTAKQMHVTKPREILAHSLLWFPFLFVCSLKEIVEILFVLIEDGWKGYVRRRDAQIERSVRRELEEIFGPEGSRKY